MTNSPEPTVPRIAHGVDAQDHWSRRGWLSAAVAAGAFGGATTGAMTAIAHSKDSTMREPFGYCLNTSTIRGQELPLPEELQIAARAGYQGVEVWVGEIDGYVKNGGSIPELAARASDLGLSIEGVIAFSEWIVDDEARRAKGLEDARRVLDLAAKIGAKRVAAPPAGAVDVALPSILTMAERYRALLELGDAAGVVPQLELWGFSQTLHRLGEVVAVALEAAHPEACVLLDVYHLYKGGSDVVGLKLLGGNAMHVLHMNDYPATPPRAEITDAHRVYPGDGVAPLGDILRSLREIGFRGMLSLELFNRELWKADAFLVASEGLAKMRAALAAALG